MLRRDVWNEGGGRLWAVANQIQMKPPGIPLIDKIPRPPPTGWGAGDSGIPRRIISPTRPLPTRACSVWRLPLGSICTKVTIMTPGPG